MNELLAGMKSHRLCNVNLDSIRELDKQVLFLLSQAQELHAKVLNAQNNANK